MIAGQIYLLDNIRERLSKNINVLFTHDQNQDILLEKLKDLASKNKGRCRLILHLKSQKGSIKTIRTNKIGVSASKKFIKDLRDVFKNDNIWIT